MSPEAVFPSPARPGQLPFNRVATVLDQGGAVLMEDVPIAVWPVTGRNVAGGRAYDHEGEAPRGHFSLLREVNRSIEVEGVRYRIVEAVEHEFLPHVALILRRMEAGGRG